MQLTRDKQRWSWEINPFAMTSSQLTPLHLICSTLARDVHPVAFGTYLQYLDLNPGSGIFQALKVHKNENFFGFDFEICTFS
jgi:hypothetical protein